MIKIYPSLLSADFSTLAEEIKSVESSGADGIHFDVMDGHFVPNLSFGAPVLAKIRKHISTEADCHLMVTEPDHLFEAFANAGADRITIHLEACRDPQRSLERIRSLGVKCGLSVKPQTPIENIFPFLDQIDLALVMSVEPGFGGQKLISHTLNKVQVLKQKKLELNAQFKIQIDGGIDDSTSKEAAGAGAEILVAGSYVFGSLDYKQAIKKLKDSGT